MWIQLLLITFVCFNRHRRGSKNPSFPACTEALLLNVLLSTMNAAFSLKTAVTWQISKKAFSTFSAFMLWGKIDLPENFVK